MLKTVFSSLFLISSTVTGFEVSQNLATSDTSSFSSDDLTIDAGASLLIENNSNVIFGGNLDIEGELFIQANPSFTNGFAVTVSSFTSQVTINGQWFIDGGGLGSSFSQQYTVLGLDFTNNGQLIWTGNNFNRGSRYDIHTSHFRNTGVMRFIDLVNKGTSIHLGAPGISIENDGTICVEEVLFLQENRINGNGCIDIGNGAVVVAGQNKQVFGDALTVFFSSVNGIFGVDIGSPQTVFLVKKWGNTNLLTAGATIDTFDYTFDLLTVSSAGRVITFNIGQGYDKSLIKIVDVDFGIGGPSPIAGGALIYEGPIPDSSEPGTCIPCPLLPAAPQDSDSQVLLHQSGSNSGSGSGVKDVSTQSGYYNTTSSWNANTQYDYSTTVVTITSCSNNACDETSSPAPPANNAGANAVSTQQSLSSATVTDIPVILQTSSNVANSMKVWTVPMGLGLLWALF